MVSTKWFSPLTTHHSPLTTHHSPLTTHHSPLTTHHSPLTTHHSPLTTHHSLVDILLIFFSSLGKAEALSIYVFSPPPICLLFSSILFKYTAKSSFSIFPCACSIGIVTPGTGS